MNRYLVTAGFRVIGADFDVHALTSALGIVPDDVFRKGERSPVSRNRGIRTFAMWSLRSPLPRDAALETHLDYLLDRLLPVKERLWNFVHSADADLRLDFYIGFALLGGQGGPVLNADTLRKLAELGVEIGFEINAGSP